MILFYFILLLKIANKNNKNFLYVYPTRKIISLVILLFNLGFIAGYSLIKHDKTFIFVLKVFLKHKNNVKKPIKKIVILSSLNIDVFISSKNACLINGNIFLLSNSFGNMSLNNAKSINQGGKMIFYLS